MTALEEDKLTLLGNLHYILAALTAFVACFPVLYFIIGVVMLGTGLNGGEEMPRIFALAFIILSAILVVAGWIFAVVIFIAGLRLKQRRSYSFCLVVSFLICLIIPLGTVLGIFTIIELTKEPVKAQFS